MSFIPSLSLDMRKKGTVKVDFFAWYPVIILKKINKTVLKEPMNVLQNTLLNVAIQNL